MTVEQFRKREYWLALAPSFHIEDKSLFDRAAGVELDSQAATQFKDDGYLQGSVDWGVDVRLMADTVRLLSASDLSPLFCFLYDEFWLLFHTLRSVYEALLGGRYYMLPDFWIWNVDPRKGEAGWKPHRDRGRQALFDDGSPKSLTTWIPLSTATPLNGCMYVVPARLDPTYRTADEIKMKFEHQSIRALPGKPGDFFIWNQALYHWGGRSSPLATESRVSMAFELQRADVPPFNTPLIDPLVVPPFERRLELIAKQIHRYRHMYDVDPKVAAMAAELLAVVAPPPAAAPEPAIPAVAAVAPPISLLSQSAAPAARRAVVASDPATSGRPGRNEACRCGSGKKYKHCHGRVA